jgi:tetratricopeptide (TPR) repeat protein
LLRFALLAIALAYLQTVTYGLVYDDKMLLGINPWVESWHYTLIIFRKSFWQFLDWKRITDYYRPIVMLFFIVMRNVFGPAPAWLHIAVIAVHGVATLLVYKMVVRLTANEMLALFSAVIFGLHPTKVESVAWISGVSDSLCLVFLLAATLAYFRWHDSHQLRWRITSVVLLFLGILSKEVLILGPLIFAVYEFSSTPGTRFDRYKKTLRMAWPYFVAVAIALGLRMYALRHFTGQTTQYENRLFYTIYSAPAATLWYVKQQIFPDVVSVQYPMLVVRTPSLVQFVFPLVVLLGVIGGIVWATRRSAAAHFLLAWGALTLAPVIAFHVLLQLHDRYSYLPSVAMSVGLAYIILRFTGDNRRVQIATLAVLIVGLGLLTRHQASYWSDDITLFEHAVKVGYNHADAYAGLVAAYSDENRSAEELDAIQRWIKGTPASPTGGFNTLFLHYLGQKDLPHARDAFQQAAPGLGPIALNSGLAKLAMADHRCVDAERYYRLALAAQPNVTDLHTKLAAAIGCQGRKKEAMEELKHAWKLRDQDTE